MQNNFPIQNNETEGAFNIKEKIEVYLTHWKWFVLAIVFCLSIALLYLRYSTPVYKISAAILIKDDKKGGLANELSAFADLGFMSGVKSNVDNEIEVLKSRTTTYNTVKELEFNVRYFNKGNVKTGEIYKKSPVHVSFLNKDKEFYKTDTLFHVKCISSTKYELLDADEVSQGKFSFGQTVKNPWGNMVITHNIDSVPVSKKNIINDVIVKISPIDKTTESYRSKFQAATTNKQTSVIALSVTDEVEQKGIDFLNTLIRRYNDDAIEDKNLVAKNTDLFINQRIDSLTKELSVVESSAESFKKKNGLTDIISDAQLFIKTASEYEKEVITTNNQLNVVNYMLDFLKKSSANDIIPSNLIPDNADAASLIEEYNKLILGRDRMLRGGTDINPRVEVYDVQIEGLKSSITKSLNTLKSSLVITQKNLQRQESFLSGKIGEVPRQERQFREIDRQQKVKEALYLYLLQKREENAISLAVTAPNANIIDRAYGDDIPVSPKRSLILLAALILGIIIPVVIIYILDLLDTKIHNYKDIEKLALPYLGDVPRSETNNELVNLHSRSGTAEALRIVRTNIEFMLSQVQPGHAKTIFVTSTVPKEGKTFISVNLATTIALTGKKILLIGMDIRNPKLDEYLNVPSKGLTNYLSSPGSDYDNYIVKYEGFEQFYIMPPGIIPPNPAELLMGPKLVDLFEKLKSEYDYILVDTAPVSLVTDTLIVANMADAFVYVSRAGYLDKRMLAVPHTLYTEGKLPNMAMLLNDTTSEKGYGYGYGYGYGADIQKESSWKEKIFGKR